MNNEPSSPIKRYKELAIDIKMNYEAKMKQGEIAKQYFETKG